MTEVKFCEIKNVDNTVPLQVKQESNYNLFNIPLKYVCISPTEIFAVLNDELLLMTDKIEFHCLSTMGIPQPRSIEIKRNCTKKIQYSNVKNLLRVTIKSNTYLKYFHREVDEDDLFKDSIWFCLNVKNMQSYTSIVDYFRTIYLSICVVSIMPLDMYDQFKIRLKLFNNELPTSDIELSSRLEDIKLSDETKLSTRRRKLKRNLDAPVLQKIKRKREPTIPSVKLLYSPSPTHSIEITESDLNCLTPKKCLNDNIINWYLTYIYHELLTESQRKTSYFYNVFFYTKLIGTSDQQEDDTPETRHSRVAKWTKKVDIFSKDFIVIPVLANKHWVPVIICFPWMSGIINYSKLFNKQNTPIASIPVNTSEFAMKIREDRVQQIKKDQNVKPMPCILVFDSLDKESRSKEVNIVRHYLKSEWDSKRKSKDGTLIFDKTTCRGYSPLVSKQTNNTDCGLYFLQYVESFFRNPLASYEKRVFVEGFLNWFDIDTINSMRDVIKLTIKEKTREILHLETYDDDDEYIL